jgi:hypothetical protein
VRSVAKLALRFGCCNETEVGVTLLGLNGYMGFTSYGQLVYADLKHNWSECSETGSENNNVYPQNLLH